jgi:site-specific DNA recombinase
MQQKAIIYARVSTEDQLDNYSIDTQITECQRVADSAHLRVIDVIYDDISGVSVDRPGMGRVLERAKAGEFHVLLCYSLDRFARDYVPRFFFETELNRNGVQLQFATQTFDNTPTGALQMDLLTAFGKHERSVIIERSQRGKKGKARSGKVVGPGGGKAKYGYRYEDGMYHIIEDQAEVVRLIFHWYLNEGLGTTSIARQLTTLRIPTSVDLAGQTYKKLPYGTWSNTSVDHILKDETYVGRYYANRRVRQGKKVVDRPRSEWIEVAVPALIDQATFDAAQQQRVKNKVNSPRNTKHFHLMQYRMRCKQCGGAMHITSSKSSNCFYYRCTGQVARMNPGWTAQCKGKYIRADLINEIVWNEVAAFIANPERIRETLLARTEDTGLQQRLTDTESQINSIKGQQVKLMDLYILGNLPQNLLDRRSRELADQLTAFEMALSDIQRQISVQLRPADVDALVARVVGLQEKIQQATDEQKRYVIDMLDIQAELDREALTLTLTGWIPSVAIDLQSYSCIEVNRYYFKLWVTLW